jgi:hypothetical protein
MAPVMILPIVALLALLFSRKNRSATEPDGHGRVTPPSDTVVALSMKAGLTRVILNFGLDVARNVERIYRLETANYKSEQFHLTNTAGMHAFSASFPFGWSMSGAGLSASDFLPTISMAENAGGVYQWVVFKTLPQAVYFLGYFLNKYGNNAGRWKSTDPSLQASYRERVAAQETPICDYIQAHPASDGGPIA